MSLHQTYQPNGEEALPVNVIFSAVLLSPIPTEKIYFRELVGFLDGLEDRGVKMSALGAFNTGSGKYSEPLARYEAMIHAYGFTEDGEKFVRLTKSGENLARELMEKTRSNPAYKSQLTKLEQALSKYKFSDGKLSYLDDQ